MEIKARAVYDKETVNKFAKITMKQTLVPLILILDILYFLLLLSSTRSLIAALITVVILTVILIPVCVAAIRQQYKLLGKFQGAVNYYLFRDNDFTCSSRTLDAGCQGNRPL